MFLYRIVIHHYRYLYKKIRRLFSCVFLFKSLSKTTKYGIVMVYVEGEVLMNRIKDFFYNKNDIIIVLIVLVVAGLLIYNRIGAIMDYPARLAAEQAKSETTQTLETTEKATTEAATEATNEAETEESSTEEAAED